MRLFCINLILRKALASRRIPLIDSFNMSNDTQTNTPSNIVLKGLSKKIIEVSEVLKNILDDLSKFMKLTDDYKQSAENYKQQLSIAESQLKKGNDQVEALERKNEFLRDSVDEEQEKLMAATEFWKSMGFCIRPILQAQTTTDQNATYVVGKHKPIPKHFEYEYKINEKVYVIEVKLQNNHVRIPSHSPALLTSADIIDMELKLNKECIENVASARGDEEVIVDWRRVVVSLWRTLINKVNTSNCN